MVFSSSVFIFLFLPIVFIINTVAGKKLSNYVLLISSLLFYAWGEPFFVLLMIVSIIINWLTGIIISKTNGAIQKTILSIGIILNLALIGYYKYAGFFTTFINSLFKRNVVHVVSVALPIGISFFTFQAISYIIDVYRGDAKASVNPVNVALYISFFPQLIAGPIVKYKDINKQIENRTVTCSDISIGFKRFIYGLGKKVLIANVLGLLVDTVYAYPIEAVDCKDAWICAFAYTFQIYYDFSGYSDMAIGLGQMFGFKFLENFEYPYLSRSITEFWRRWHISLGTWFREYVYIPLGGNRKGALRTYLNLLAVFFLTGLWHGADWSFVIWGLYHGFFIIMERAGLKKLLDKSNILSRIYTMGVVISGWVFFRADNTKEGLRYLARMLMPWKFNDPSLESWMYSDNKTTFAFIFAVVGMGILTMIIPDTIKRKWKDSIFEAVFCVAILVLSLASIASNTYNPFIYFQF